MGDDDCRRGNIVDDSSRRALSTWLLLAPTGYASCNVFLPAQDTTTFRMTSQWCFGPHVLLRAVNDFDRIAVKVENGGAVVACSLVAHRRLAVNTAARFERGGEKCVDGGPEWCGEGDVCCARFVTAPAS